MPIYEYLCRDCGKISELFLSKLSDQVRCIHCGSDNVKKLFSAHSAISASHKQSFPGAGDTTCCGSAPGTGRCGGPGSCCGKA